VEQAAHEKAQTQDYNASAFTPAAGPGLRPHRHQAGTESRFNSPAGLMPAPSARVLERPAMRLSVRYPVVRITVALGAIAAAVGAGIWYQSTLLPRRFALVDRTLYRSGEVSPAQLERLHAEYGIRRVISLLDATAPVTVAEREAAGRLGIDWYNIPMRGNGDSTPEARTRVLELLSMPNAPPTLVHCAAGVNRTGLAIGLYRIKCQGWSLEQVLAEMRDFGFEDIPKHSGLRQALAEAARAATSQPTTSPAAVEGDKTSD
jgi:hypothetical protein